MRPTVGLTVGDHFGGQTMRPTGGFLRLCPSTPQKNKTHTHTHTSFGGRRCISPKSPRFPCSERAARAAFLLFWASFFWRGYQPLLVLKGNQKRRKNRRAIFFWGGDLQKDPPAIRGRLGALEWDDGRRYEGGPGPQ